MEKARARSRATCGARPRNWTLSSAARFRVAVAAADGRRRSFSTSSNSASPPCSFSTSPTSAPSACTSSRSASCLAGNWMSSRLTKRAILQMWSSGGRHAGPEAQNALNLSILQTINISVDYLSCYIQPHVERSTSHRSVSFAVPAQLRRAGRQDAVRAEGRLQPAFFSSQRALLRRHGPRPAHDGARHAALQRRGGARRGSVSPFTAGPSNRDRHGDRAQADRDDAALENRAAARRSARHHPDTKIEFSRRALDAAPNSRRSNPHSYAATSSTRCSCSATAHPPPSPEGGRTRAAHRNAGARYIRSQTTAGCRSHAARHFTGSAAHRHRKRDDDQLRRFHRPGRRVSRAGAPGGFSRTRVLRSSAGASGRRAPELSS